MLKIKLLLSIVIISFVSADIVRNDLVFEMDASRPGNNHTSYWRPTVGNLNGGRIFEYLDSNLPIFSHEFIDGKYIWYYRFSPVLTGKCGVGNIGVEGDTLGKYVTNFNYDADFSIEAWVRPGKVPPEQERGIIVSSQNGCNGYRFGIRDAGNNSWYFDFVMRDCTGTAYYIVLHSNNKFNGQYNYSDWVHVVFTYNGTKNDAAVCRMYINGQDINIAQSTVVPYENNDADDFVPVDDCLTIGARNWRRSDTGGGMLMYDGDISIVRIYKKVLNLQQAVQNFTEGNMTANGYICGTIPGDINKDCIVDLADVAAIADNWLKSSRQAKYPYRVLFNNDTTNITTSLSSYNQDGIFTESKLRANIDEVAGSGVEVFMINPAHTWVPWWQSRVYSMTEHYRWYEQKYGVVPNLSYNEYIINGGDILQASIDRCREKGLVPFVTYRMNDAQLLQRREDNPPVGSAFHFLSEFYIEHVPNYCIGTSMTRDDMAQNFAIEDVRAHRLAFLREIAEYDIEGIELDFHRYCSYFKLNETTVQQRRDIMAAFMADMRGVIDETSRNNSHRWLAVRVPCYFEFFDRMGLDLKAWVDAGVDIVIASGDYFTVHDSDIAAMIKMIPGTPVYLEMHYTTCSGNDRDGVYTWRRTTDNQFYTAAHLAYSRGAAGITAYNFQYYRGPDTQGLSEPPFHIFNNISDPDWVASQPQHYVLSTTWMSVQYTGTMPLNYSAPGQSRNFNMDMAHPKGGWKIDGRIKIQAFNNLGDSVWKLKCNGIELVSTQDVSEPYNNPYPNLLDSDSMRRAWIVPRVNLIDGINRFELEMVSGANCSIRFIDLSIE